MYKAFVFQQKTINDMANGLNWHELAYEMLHLMLHLALCRNGGIFYVIKEQNNY